MRQYTHSSSQEFDYYSSSAEILNDEDLEEGELSEDEETANAKNLKANIEPEKIKIQGIPPAATPAPKKPVETQKTLKSSEYNEKLPREPLVPFLNKGKKRHYDDQHDDECRWKKDGKRNRKSQDLEREMERPGVEEEEDMMLVRGASPSRLPEEGDKWDREEDMEMGDGPRRPTRSFRGRGGVSRRGERSRGRGRGRGSLRMGKRKRLDNRDTCQFFLKGRCHRGSECPYSHDILPPRKPELCKFFMKDCCAKEDKCLYMHSEFPCKYFHTGMKCYANKKCKFNHGVLTDPLRNILAKHLDTAPKEILGEFVRRDGRDREREDMRDRDLRREREPRDMRNDLRDRGDPRDMRGDLRDGRGDMRDMRGDPRDGRGDMRDMRGDPRDDRGELRDMRGDPRDGRGDMRDMRGDPRDDRGDLRDMRLDPRDMRDLRDSRGDLRDSRGDVRDMRDPRDIRGDPRDNRGDFRDMRSDPRDMRGDSRDLRDSRDNRDVRDMREFLRNKNERDRKINSLFDRPPSVETRSPDCNHTPMPSPTQRSQDSTKSSDRDRDRDYGSPDREREKEFEHERKKREKHERSKERRAKKEKSKEHKRERKERREKEREKRREHKEKTGEKTGDNNKSFDLMSPTHEGEVNTSEVPNPSEKMYEQDRKNNTSGEDNSMFPEHLPKKQRELFLRIQQQQREAENSQASANDDDDEDKMAEENWYSSDEETSPSSTLPSILKNLAQSSGSSSQTNAANSSSNLTTSSSMLPILNLLAPAAATSSSVPKTTPAVAPVIPANLDLINLSSVFEALSHLQKINSTANKSGSQPEATSNTTLSSIPEPPAEPPKSEPPKPEPPKLEPMRVRDPRLRLEASSTESRRSSVESYPTDMDLRLKSAGAGKAQPSSDVDLRSLPFKPVQHTAACEIEASLASHPPLPWHLAPFTVPRADYASLHIQPRPGVNDPRLRWKMRSPTEDTGLPRDPRQRLLDDPVRDPRARAPLLATPDIPPLGPPPTPRYDEDHRPQMYMDSDMRHFPPPTPRLEDEAYTPGPSRPMDPRQRSLGLDDPRRTNFPGRPDDVDLRPHRVPFMNYNK